MSRFTLPRDIYYGANALENLKNLKGSRAVLVLGGGSMKKFGFVDKALGYLKEAGIETRLIENVEPDPSVETVMSGAAVMREFEPDWIISMGGGSPIDAAKAIAMMAPNEGNYWDYMYGGTGGGKKMIADYESPDRPAHSKLDAPKSYGLSLAHKHLPEMQKISGLAHTPAFVPVVCDYYSGMQVLVPLDLKLAGTSAEAVAAGIADYYKEGATVSVHALNEPLPENGLYSNAMAGTDRMELYSTVNAAGDQMMLVSLFDNLGKGSSGAAIQCMNLMLGLPETQGLE